MSEGDTTKPFHGDGSPKNYSPQTLSDQDNKDLRHDSSFSEKHQELVPSQVLPAPGKVAPPSSKVRDSGFGASVNQVHGSNSSSSSNSSPSSNSHLAPSNSNSNLPPGSNFSSRSNSSVGSNSSVDPPSNHDNSTYSVDSPDTAVEGGTSEGGGGACGGPREKEHYMLPIEAKTKDGGALKGRRRKSSSKEEQAATEPSFTILSPFYTYKWHIGLPDAYKLNSKAALAAHEETEAGSTRKKSNNTKLKLDFEIMPDITEPNNERVAKISVALTVENARLQEYECTAVTDLSLYNRHAGEMLLQEQEVRKFAGRSRARFLMDLGSQERIEKSANRSLEVGIRVKVQLRTRICSEDIDGFVSVCVK